MGRWKYKVPFSFDVQRAGEDLEAKRVTIEEARDAVALAIRNASERFPQTEEGQAHADKFIDIAEYIESQDELDEINVYISELYDYADDEKIWLDENPKGTLDWRPGS